MGSGRGRWQKREDTAPLSLLLSAGACPLPTFYFLLTTFSDDSP